MNSFKERFKSVFSSNYADEEYDMDDIIIHDTKIELEGEKLKYLLFDFSKKVSANSYERVFKAIKLVKITRIPKKDLGLSQYLDMQAGVLTGYYQNQVNYIQIMANIVHPYKHGLIYAYGVQGVSSNSYEEAMHEADIQMSAVERAISGTFRTLEYVLLSSMEANWIFEKLGSMADMRIIRGVPGAKNEAGRMQVNAFFGLANANAEEQSEEFLLGMDDYEYLFVLTATRVEPETISRWKEAYLKESTYWASLQQGQKSMNFGISMPMVYSANIGSSEGWGSSQGESFGENYGTSYTHSDGTSESWSQGVSHSVGVNSSHSVGINDSQGYNEGVNAGENYSESVGRSEGVNLSHSQSVGTNQSDSSGISHSISESVSDGTSSSTSHSTSSTTTSGTSESWGSSHTVSDGTSHTVSNGTSHSTGSSSGGSSSSGWNYGTGSNSSASVGSSSSVSGSINAGAFGIGGSVGETTGDSISNSVGSSISNGISGSSGSSWGTSVSNGTSHTVSDGTSHSVSDGTSHSTGISNSVSNGVSNSVSNGISHSTSLGQSQGTSQSHSVGSSQSFSNGIGSSISQNIGSSAGASRGMSQGASVSSGSSESWSSGSSESWGESSSHSTGISSSDSYGTSQGTSTSRSTSTSTSGGTSRSVGGSMGLGPSLSFGKSFQWQDVEVTHILDLLNYSTQRIIEASNNLGMWFTDIYVATESEEASAAATQLAMSAWHDKQTMTCPLQVYRPSEIEKEYLFKHMSVFSPSVKREGVPGEFESYKYSTMLLSSELNAYSHPPRVNVGGIQAAIDDPPVLTIPGDRQKGDIFLGYVANTESYSLKRGYKSDFRYTIQESEIHHAYISGASRSGKTVAALRLVAETYNHVRRGEKRKRMRFLIMDPKQDWRSLAKVVPEEHFRFYSLSDPRFHMIKMNLMKIPHGVYTERYADKLREVFIRSYGLGDRGFQILGQAINTVYKKAGCYDEDALYNEEDADGRCPATERSKNVTMEDVCMELKLEIENCKQRDRAEAIQRIVDRMENFSNPLSTIYKVFCNRGDDGFGIDDLLGGDDVIVLESYGMDTKTSGFIFALITSSVYQYAVSNGGFVRPKDQFETVLVIEEANQVLIGEDQDNLGGANPFENILDQSAGYGLFIWTLTQKIADMPDSVLANSALKLIGRQDRKDDIELSIVQIGKDAMIADRVFKNWLPTQPTGWFIIKSSRNRDFTKNAPVHVMIEYLEVSPPSNEELDQILEMGRLKARQKKLMAHSERIQENRSPAR